MQLKELGSTGEKIPAIGMGCWGLGRDPEAEKAALRLGLDSGLRLIDTAEIYGTEGIVGDVIKGRRDDIFIATKVSPAHFSHDSVISACDASLKRLGLKCVDLYQLHWPNHRIPIKETMSAMEELVDAGKVRHIGISNFDVNEMREARDAVKKYDIVSNQIEYSVLVRDIESGILDYCTKNKMTVIAYSPFAHGRLFSERYDKVRNFLSEVGARHKSTAAQVALAWLTAKDRVVAIPKASSVEHMKEIAGAGGLRLSAKELEGIGRFLLDTG